MRSRARSPRAKGSRRSSTATVTDSVAAYVLSARLVASLTGEEMATFRETAPEAEDIIPAIGRLSQQAALEDRRVAEDDPERPYARAGHVRHRCRRCRNTWPVNRALEVEGDYVEGAALLEEAIALDTGFAMAYRKLATEFRNRRYAASA